MPKLNDIIINNLEGPGVFRVNGRNVKYNARGRYLMFEDDWTVINLDTSRIIKRDNYQIEFVFENIKYIFEIVEPIKIK